MSQVPPSSGSPYGQAPYGQPYGQDTPGASPYTTPSASSAPGAYPPADLGGYGQTSAPQAPAYGTPGYPSGPAYPAAPAYGSPVTYGAGPAPQVRSTTGPKVLLTVGLIALIGSIITFAISTTAVFNVAGSLSVLPGNGSATATLDSADVYGIYSAGLATCEVTSSSGDSVDITPIARSESTEVDGNPLIGIFTPPTSGDYTVTCQTNSTKPVYLGRAANGSNMLASGMGILVSLLLGVPSVVLTLAGAIWWGTRRSHNKKAQAAAGGYPGAQF
ncbi:hypothetical protein [Actinomyces sp. W5033]|uniref:hypothetical protein n=1 Tax=Actinomyces sp. W5033 TaxID=3446479 RepID=UPI003EE09263